MDFSSLLASRLRELRLRHNLTQHEFAEMAGVGFKYYQQIESGRKKQFYVDTVQRLAMPYGMDAWQLLGPGLPPTTMLVQKVMESRVHNKRRRGPYSS
jgi:transcriptional regulator with XRE-family HTH domain